MAERSMPTGSALKSFKGVEFALATFARSISITISRSASVVSSSSEMPTVDASTGRRLTLWAAAAAIVTACRDVDLPQIEVDDTLLALGPRGVTLYRTDAPNRISRLGHAARQWAPGTWLPLKLRVFVDKSVVEVYANDRQAICRRVYPARDDSLGVVLFANGGEAKICSLKAWEMMPANPY